MLSQPPSPSPLPLRLPSPAPVPPLPENGSESEPVTDSDFSSESEPESESESEPETESEQESDSEPSVNEEVETKEPLPKSRHVSRCPYDSDEEYWIKLDKNCWDNYFQQLRQSRGFDIKDYPGALPGTTVFPMPSYLESPANVEEMKDFAAKALEHYNKKNDTEYEVNEILKVNGDDCGQYSIFYITFSVKNGEKEYFQAKVVECINKSLRFPVVRPRAKGGVDI